jgi:hypothetical protein
MCCHLLGVVDTFQSTLLSPDLFSMPVGKVGILSGLRDSLLFCSWFLWWSQLDTYKRQRNRMFWQRNQEISMIGGFIFPPEIIYPPYLMHSDVKHTYAYTYTHTRFYHTNDKEWEMFTPNVDGIRHQAVLYLTVSVIHYSALQFCNKILPVACVCLICIDHVQTWIVWQAYT